MVPPPTPRNLATLPKAHLHLHFTGSMRHATVTDLAEKNGVRLPNAFTRQQPMQWDNTPRGWFRFQRLYDAARSTIRTADDLERIIIEAAEDDATEGSRWLELQVDPTSYGPLVGGITPALEIILNAATTASATTDCDVAIIVAASRVRHPLDARTLARLAARYAGTGPGTVVGFGLSNDERRGFTAEFARAFTIAREAGLALVPHSGELLGPDHITTTLHSLKPHRLGHGVRCAEDPALLKRIVDACIPLEVCPTSNVSLGVYQKPSDVPLTQLLDAGATIALGADDPLLFGSRLLAQYESARTDHQLDDDTLAHLGRSSINASCAPKDIKDTLLAGVDDWLA